MPEVTTPPRPPAPDSPVERTDEQPPDAPAPGAAGTHPWWQRALMLWALFAFAVAQPLFDLLSHYPEFFAVKGTVGSDLVLFVVLALVPPLILFGLVCLACTRMPERAGNLVESALVAVLATLCVLQFFN